ncbi:MAG: hypothetical protein ACRCY8_00245 [Dermatophilaceae bacterium]
MTGAPSGIARLLRGALATTLLVVVGSAAHSAAGGGGPSPLAAAALLVVTAPLARHALRVRLELPRLLAALTVSQLVTHLALVVGHHSSLSGAPHAHVPGAATGSGSATVATGLTSAELHLDGRMLVLHGMATVMAALLLRNGPAVVDRVLDLVPAVGEAAHVGQRGSAVTGALVHDGPGRTVVPVGLRGPPVARA